MRGLQTEREDLLVAKCLTHDFQDGSLGHKASTDEEGLKIAGLEVGSFAPFSLHFLGHWITGLLAPLGDWAVRVWRVGFHYLFAFFYPLVPCVHSGQDCMNEESFHLLFFTFPLAVLS